MPMLMPTAISPGLRLKRQRHLLDHRADPLEHIREHRIIFELQIIRPNLNRRMPVAKVISRARKRQRIPRGDHQNGLRRRDYPHQRTILRDQHVTIAQHGTARQHQRHLFTVVERRRQTALATRIEIERQCRRTLDQHCSELDLRIDQFVDSAHD